MDEVIMTKTKQMNNIARIVKKDQGSINLEITKDYVLIHALLGLGERYIETTIKSLSFKQYQGNEFNVSMHKQAFSKEMNKLKENEVITIEKENNVRINGEQYMTLTNTKRVKLDGEILNSCTIDNSMLKKIIAITGCEGYAHIRIGCNKFEITNCETKNTVSIKKRTSHKLTHSTVINMKYLKDICKITNIKQLKLEVNENGQLIISHEDYKGSFIYMVAPIKKENWNEYIESSEI